LAWPLVLDSASQQHSQSTPDGNVPTCTGRRRLFWRSGLDAGTGVGETERLAHHRRERPSNNP
jgi:hypothetical protein